MITRDIAATLPVGTVLHHVSMRNADDMPIRCRVTGRCKTWVTRPEDFRLPVKYGLRGSFAITPDNATNWELPA